MKRKFMTVSGSTTYVPKFEKTVTELLEEGYAMTHVVPTYDGHWISFFELQEDQ